MQNRDTATEYLLWSFLENRYPGCISRVGEISPEAYILAKPLTDSLADFKALQTIAKKLTVRQIHTLERLFDNLKD